MSLTIPNLLSLLRMGLVPVFIIAVLDGNAGRALLVFAVAGITDLLDGLIARFYDQRSLLGAYLDPIADKMLLASAYVVLAVPGQHPGLQIPAWVTVLVLGRDLIIVTIALVLYLAVGVRSFPPMIISKVTTFIQVATVVLVLVSGLRGGVAGLAEASLYTMALLTAISGLMYIWRANQLAAQAIAKRPELGA